MITPSPYHAYLRKGWILLLSIVLGVPLSSWALHTTFSDMFISSFFFFKILGQFCGIVGAQLFAFSLILSGRFRFIEQFFGGLDTMYRLHHKIGLYALFFLCVHPVMLALRYVQDSWKEVFAFLSPVGNTVPILFGMGALLMMAVLIAVTMYGSIFKYPVLRTFHKFLGAAFFLGTIHIFLIPSSLSDDIVLKVSVLATAIVGLLVFTYKTLLGEWLIPRYDYIVTDIKNLPSTITEITLKPVTKKLLHLPGQFSILSFPNTKSFLITNEEHPFSFTSSGRDGIIRYSIKSLGDYTSLISHISLGDHARIEGPFGEFSYVYGKEKQVWVAGGVGVTPFVSMVTYLMQEESLRHEIDFYYSVKTEADAAYRELFEDCTRKFSNFKFHLIPSDTKGYISGELLHNEISNILERDIYVCGPPMMMDAMTKQLGMVGVKRNNIHTEKFALLR